MSKLRSISTAFWSDPFIEECSVSEKLLFLYLVTNEKTNMLGIYEASIRKISFETGIDQQTVRKALKRFESLGKVKYSDNYVVVVNFLRHQNFNTNMKKSAVRIYNDLPESIKGQEDKLDEGNPLEAFETLSKRLGMVRKREVELEDESERESESENRGKPSVFQFQKSLIALGANEQLAAEWMKVRRAKKAVNTETAFNGFVRELEKSGLPVDYVLKQCVERSWKGFKAEWLKGSGPAGISNPTKVAY